MVVLPPYIYSIMVGLMLGDGHLQLGTKRKNARLKFNQTIKHAQFALWLFNSLAHYCQSVPYLYTSQINEKTFFCLSFQTRSYPCFTSLHSAWYLEKVQILPPTIFERSDPCCSSNMESGRWLQT